jgi:membrane-associated phospholipid phosphatase
MLLKRCSPGYFLSLALLGLGLCSCTALRAPHHQPFLESSDVAVPDGLAAASQVAETEKPAPQALPPQPPCWVDCPVDEGHHFDHERFWQDVDLSLADHRTFYSPQQLTLLALGIGAAAPFANTYADRSIRDYYQDEVREDIPDGLAEGINYAGQLWVVFPLLVETRALFGKSPADYRTDGGLGEWSNRSLRAVAVGYPPTVALYGILGSTRPAKNDSRWHPFQNFHGVSGHTFIGAIPFLTAASMTEEPLFQVPLVLGSFLTGWSRVHKDRHYFSQVALGWWLAYLSVRSVHQTQAEPGPWSVVPLPTPEGPGVGIHLEY